MTRTLIVATLAALIGVAGCASTETVAQTPVAYTVVKEDATIAFSNTVRNFRVGADRTLLLEAPGRRWYRATLNEPCKSDLRYEETVALYDRASTSVSKFTDVIVNGRRCQILTLDEIADPKAAEAAARNATPAPTPRPAT